MADIKLDIGDISHSGAGLRRPECVLCFESGDIIGSQLGHGIFHISPSGLHRFIGNVKDLDGSPFIPNGLAFWPGHGVLVANMGEAGGLWRLDSAGIVSEFIRSVDGVALRAANFVLLDRENRIWITVTTRQWPIFKAFTPKEGPEIADGFIAVIDEFGPRIVADNLAFANEMRIDEDQQMLYVAETFGRRITRFHINPDASLSKKELFAGFGEGTFPDGLAFDSQGYLWATSLVSNRLLRISPDGAPSIVISESDQDHITSIENGLRSGGLGRDDFLKVTSKHLKNISSLAFGGLDLKTIYLGSLSSDTLLTLQSPISGAAMAHWKTRLSF